MGSNISTLTATNAAKETILGIMLATPFFIRYFFALRDHYLNDKQLPQYFIQEEPENRKKVDDAIHQLEKERDSNGFYDYNNPVPSPLPASPHSSTASPSSCSDDMSDFKLDSPSSREPEEEEDQEFVPLIPEQAERPDPDAETSPLIFRTPAEQEKERQNLEEIANLLYSKAKKASRSEKISISQALFQLGELLFQDDKTKSAQSVLRKTERLQKQVIHETFSAVASAMRQQADYYQDHDMSELALVYRRAASSLRKETAGPKELGRAWAIHKNVGKQVMADKEDLKAVLSKVERRLKRASREAMALSETLKLEADCAARSRRQQRSIS